jgi:cyclic pyranopterin phosphate synthase
LSGVDVVLEPTGHGVKITATVSTTGQTGVEMEAMTAVSVAALTIYDMVKGVERGVTIESVLLRKKVGGNTGTWVRPEGR